MILFIAFLLLLIRSFGQQITSRAPSTTQQVYLQKSKKQKTAAWGLFAVGTVMLVAGAALAADQAGERWDGQGGEGLEAAGVVAAMQWLEVFLYSLRHRGTKETPHRYRLKMSVFNI